jgi:hypothetical protein
MNRNPFDSDDEVHASQEQAMTTEAKGPYAYSARSTSGYSVTGPGIASMCVTSETTAVHVVVAANLAHHSALTSQAARVKELEEACQNVVDMLNPFIGSVTAGECVSVLKKALTPKEPHQ